MFKEKNYKKEIKKISGTDSDETDKKLKIDLLKKIKESMNKIKTDDQDQ